MSRSFRWPVRPSKAMSGQYYRWCYVPQCTNTSVKTPDKIFISVPVGRSIRKLWWRAAHRDPPIATSTIYCCEDHFNLEEDLQNYRFLITMGSRAKLKPGVLPHRFDCQGRGVMPNNNRISFQMKKKRKEALSSIEYYEPDDPKKANKIVHSALDPRGIEVVMVNEQPISEASQEGHPLQEQDPLSIKPDTDSWEVAGTKLQETPEFAGGKIHFSDRFYDSLKEELEVKEEEIQDLKTEVAEYNVGRVEVVTFRDDNMHVASET